MTFPLVALIFFLSGSLLWLGVNAPHLVDLTAGVLEWCRVLMLSCISYAPLAGAAVLWVSIAAIGGGVLYAVVKNGAGLLRSHMALSRLPVSYRGGTVALVLDDSLKLAFTHGILRPRIYISTGLVKSLTRDELAAVLLHEACHRRGRDPLKFLLASFVRDAFFYLPVSGCIVRFFQSEMEMAADDSAVQRIGDPLVLAGAILKVALAGGGMRVPAPVSVSIRGTGSAERRVRRLVEGTDEREKGPGPAAVASSVLVTLLLFLGLVIPATASFNPGTCTIDHCDTHVENAENAGEGCATHCDVRA